MAGLRLKNNILSRFLRTFTSYLPVSKNRTGQCKNCGECCKLPTICPFLNYKKDGKSECRIYKIRHQNCRKYPRTQSEFITKPTCGYRFR